MRIQLLTLSLALTIAGCPSSSTSSKASDGGAAGSAGGAAGSTGGGTDASVPRGGQAGAAGGAAGGAGGSAGAAGGAGGSAGAAGGSAGGTGGTAGAGGSGDADAGTDAAAACNAISNGAALIKEIDVATAVPTATGGTFQAGTYYQTLSSVYTGPGGVVGGDGKTEQSTIVISGATASTATIQVVDSSDGKAAEHGNGTLEISGTSLILTTTCPAGAQKPKVYDFSVSTDGTVFTLIHTSGTLGSSQTFTKQ